MYYFKKFPPVNTIDKGFTGGLLSSKLAKTGYISLTQFIDRGWKTISVRHGKESDVDAFIEKSPIYIPHPELTENYQRKYGRGKVAKDLRNFDRENALSQKELNEARTRLCHLISLMIIKNTLKIQSSDCIFYGFMI